MATAIDHSAGEGDSGARIVAAADLLLEQGGLDGLTVRAILARTGLSRRAFYERFQGKDDVMLALFAHTIHASAEHFRMMFRDVGAPLDRLRLLIVRITEGNAGGEEPFRIGRDRRSAALSREHLRLAEARPKDLQGALAPLIGLIAEQLEAGARAASIRACDPVDTATLIYNLASSTAHNAYLAAEANGLAPDQRQRMAAEIWEFCRRAIIA